MSLMKKVVVDEAQWYRGKGDFGSSLRRKEDGLMCCLGFACLQSGATEIGITGRGFPDTVEGVPAWLKDFVWTREVGKINDAEHLTEADRKAQLIQKFAQKGITLSFVPSDLQDNVTDPQ